MSSSENVFAEVIEVAKFIDEFRGHYFALPSYQEKIDLLKDQIELALEKLDAIPIEKRESQDEASMYLYLRGKLLDVSPAYNQEAERLLTDAVKLNSSVVDAWICLGTCVSKRGDLDKAKSCFNSGLEQDPNNKQLLLQLSVLERRQCIGETEVENPVEIINDCIKHVKEAIALDIQDGISWYILGNACLTAYFVTGCWDINMLLQSLKAYKNALKDERMKLSSHMCYNCAMTYKYFEDYETALSGFEAAELLDPDLNGLEQAFNLYEILERVNAFLQVFQDLSGSPTSWLPTVESLASSLASVDLNPTYEKATVNRLIEGPNLSKAVTGKVLLSVENPSEIPIYYLVCDSDGTCFVITVYGVRSTAIKEEDQVTLLDPFYHIFDFESRGKHYQFKSLRIDFMEKLRVNGAIVSPEHVVHRSMYPQLKEA